MTKPDRPSITAQWANSRLAALWRRSLPMRMQLLAIFVALHIIAIFLQAMPSTGGGMDRSAWKNLTVQRELAAWNQRMHMIGITMSDAQFEETLWQFAKGFMSARRDVLAPFMWYYNYLGTWQAWRMFVAPHTHPSKLHVRIREHGVWRTIYELQSHEFTWRRWQFEDRLRYPLFLYSWPNYRGSYHDFAKWIFDQVERDFPAAEQVETEFFSYDTPDAASVRAGRPIKGEFHDKLTRVIAR